MLSESEDNGDAKQSEKPLDDNGYQTDESGDEPEPEQDRWNDIYQLRDWGTMLRDDDDSEGGAQAEESNVRRLAIGEVETYVWDGKWFIV